MSVLTREAPDEGGRAEVGQVELEQVGRVLGGHEHAGVVLARVASGSVDEPASAREGGQRPRLVDEDALAGVDVAEVHAALGEPRREVHDAHRQPLVQVLTAAVLSSGRARPRREYTVSRGLEAALAGGASRREDQAAVAGLGRFAEEVGHVAGVTGQFGVAGRLTVGPAVESARAVTTWSHDDQALAGTAPTARISATS